MSVDLAGNADPFAAHTTRKCALAEVCNIATIDFGDCYASFESSKRGVNHS